MFIQNFVIFIFYLCTLAVGYEVKLTNDGPLVRGGIINFSATVYYRDQIAENEKFEFIWEDNAIPQHSRDVQLEGSTDSWSVVYSKDHPSGEYIVQVEVKRCVWDVVCYSIGSGRTFFTITERLNGNLRLLQHNQTEDHNFVANNETVVHFVDIKNSDLYYIGNATTVLTYWLIDCTYYGITTDYKFAFNYTVAEQTHLVEALVVADFTPLPPTTTVPPTTTTIKPSTTTTKPTTTTTQKPTVRPTNSTIVPISPSTSISSIRAISKRSITSGSNNSSNSISRIMQNVNGTLVPYNEFLPFVCNSSHIVTDSMKTYGYFSRELIVKAPLSDINITGNTWLQPGNLLKLTIQCSGSKKLEYCIQYETGNYNVTGNETCFVYLPLDACEFSITRFISQNRTIVIILKNDVSKVVKSVFVNVYKVNKQMQLSVIVVPVAFSLVAVVLIIFGVAYYIQNRSRFIVEVADFHFGQQLDIEYKTFRERLRDSVANAFTRAPSPSASTSEVPVWPPGQKYGSMT